ncbi:MAG: hypothetical protein ABSF85_11360 [Terriglobales bacterium]|jgi:hypothetical protein
MGKNGASDKVAVEPMQTVVAMECRSSGQRYLRFEPEFVVLRDGYDVCLHLLFELGEFAPADARDRVQRDLACDTLDSLRMAEGALLRGYENQAMVLLRRAYETVSLMTYFLNFPDEVRVWESGKEIRNCDIREALDAAAMPEPKGHLRDLYRLYSDFTHVNRKTVWNRMLGEGNRFTVGAQGNVSDKTVGAYLREMLRMTMWFVDVMNFAFAPVAKTLGPNYASSVLAYRGTVQRIADHLAQL